MFKSVSNNIFIVCFHSLTVLQHYLHCTMCSFNRNSLAFQESISKKTSNRSEDFREQGTEEVEAGYLSSNREYQEVTAT